MTRSGTSGPDTGTPDTGILEAAVGKASGAAPGGPEEGRAAPAFDRRMLEALICPRTHARLSYDAERQELVSKAAGLAFPIRNGIPIMLEDEARAIDD